MGKNPKEKQNNGMYEKYQQVQLIPTSQDGWFFVQQFLLIFLVHVFWFEVKC
jgi:hypothetical protein